MGKKALPNNEADSLSPDIVDRPAFVVEKLMEIEIDNGADLITVEIHNGGITSIKITGNGNGIHPDEFLSLADMPVSQSDILNQHISNNIGYFLSYIIPFADIEIITRCVECDQGTVVHYYRGKLVNQYQVDSPVGVTFTIKNLFFNYPEKYKQLKNDAFETMLVQDILRRICLMHLYISIRFVNNGNIAFHSPGNKDLAECIALLYGKSSIDTLICINTDDPGLQIKGFISQSQKFYETSSNEIVLINGSHDHNLNLIAHINNIYADLLPAGKYPFVFLEITKGPQVSDTSLIGGLDNALKSAICDTAAGKKRKPEDSVSSMNRHIELGKYRPLLFSMCQDFPNFSGPFQGHGKLFFEYAFVEQNHILYIFHLRTTIQRMSPMDTRYTLESDDVGSVLDALAHLDAHTVFDIQHNPLLFATKEQFFNAFTTVKI